MTENKAKLEAA